MLVFPLAFGPEYMTMASSKSKVCSSLNPRIPAILSLSSFINGSLKFAESLFSYSGRDGLFQIGINASFLKRIVQICFELFQ